MAAKKKVKPKQMDLIENREIKELNEAAEAYADVRDERQALTRKEVESKGTLLDLMHKKKMSDYVSPGGTIEIHVIVEKEKVRVKIKKDSDGEAVDMT